MIPSEGLQQLVDALSERLQRSVAIDDPEIRLIVASRHFGDEDQVRVQSVLGRHVEPDIVAKVFSFGVQKFVAPARIPPMPEFGARSRVCVPIRYSGALLGYLWLIDDERLGAEAISDASSVAERAAVILYQREAAVERQQLRVDALLRDLLAASPRVRDRAAADLAEDRVGPAYGRVTVAVVSLPAADRRMPDTAIRAQRAEAGRRLIRGIAASAPDGSVVASQQGGRLVVLVAEQPGGVRTATGVAEGIVADAAVSVGSGTTAGVGSTVGAVRAARASYEQARIADRAAARIAGMGPVVSWDALGAYALLARVGPKKLSSAGYPPAIMRLVRHRNATVLLTTVETFLDLAGDVQRCAQALHIHRTTLYQRLDRVEQVSGLSMADGTDRLTLHLSIKLAHLSGLTMTRGGVEQAVGK